MKFNFKQSSPIILTILGTIGAGAAIYTTIKATKKTETDIAEKSVKKICDGEIGELSTKEKTKIVIKNYAVPAGLYAGSMICFWGATILSKKQQVKLISANTLMQQSFKAYRNELINIHGEEADKQIMENLARKHHNFHQWDLDAPDEKLLWYEPLSGQWFEKYEREVMDAEYHFNRNFCMRGDACFNEWLDFLGIEEINEDIGWSMKYGYFWVDFEHEYKNDNGKEYIELSYVFGPDDEYGDDY